MKDILIDERFQPYSHEPGTWTLLPGNGMPLQIFPSLIRFPEIECQLDIQGPVEQFTILNDLEKGRITISGKEKRGWLRIHILASQDGQNVRLFVDRAPPEGIHFHWNEKTVLLNRNEGLDLFENKEPFIPYQVVPCDRLSFGCHKAQDWDLIKRRRDLSEILPFWHRFGQLILQAPLSKNSGMYSLFEECKKQKEEKNWLNFFMCGFKGMLVPQNEDSLHQGIVDAAPSADSPLWILSEGAKLIRELFIQQEPGFISILPSLFPSLPFGKLVNVPLEGGGLLSIEWSKKTLRRMNIFSEQEKEMAFKFPSNVKSYRLKDKGERKLCSSMLSIEKNTQYYFDNFQN